MVEAALEKLNVYNNGTISLVFREDGLFRKLTSYGLYPDPDTGKPSLAPTKRPLEALRRDFEAMAPTAPVHERVPLRDGSVVDLIGIGVIADDRPARAAGAASLQSKEAQPFD